ncbi:MAG: hypothetical protein E6G79_03180 [Alphaproteobacteria bacterium]|nr:MAG: hypothetical protein E6G79_03180 [Alphaproteobacteria bacterium]
MRTVEVRSDRAAFPEMLGAMREWLDRNNRPLVRFETETNGDIVVIKIRFDADDLAEGFRQSFKGCYDALP